MTDEELIKRLREGQDLHVLAANRIEALVKERDATWNTAIRTAAEKFTNGGWAQSDILALLKPEVKS